jgi:hypothetical protein
MLAAFPGFVGNLVRLYFERFPAALSQCRYVTATACGAFAQQGRSVFARFFIRLLTVFHGFVPFLRFSENGLANEPRATYVPLAFASA